jgi:hypothetical protein
MEGHLVRTLLSLVAVVCLANLSLAEETAWHKLISKGGSAAAMFPGTPKVNKAPMGEQILLEADAGATVYLLQWTKLPNQLDIEDEAVVKKMFDNAQASALKSLVGSKLLSAEDDEHDGLPSRDISLDAPGIGIYRTRLILDEDKLFQVTVAAKKEVAQGDDADAFLHSFRLLED